MAKKKITCNVKRAKTKKINAWHLSMTLVNALKEKSIEFKLTKRIRKTNPFVTLTHQFNTSIFYNNKI